MPRRKGNARDDEGQSHNFENMQTEDQWTVNGDHNPDCELLGCLGSGHEILVLPENFFTEEDAERFAARMQEISEQTTREP